MCRDHPPSCPTDFGGKQELSVYMSRSLDTLLSSCKCFSASTGGSVILLEVNHFTRAKGQCTARENTWTSLEAVT